MFEKDFNKSIREKKTLKKQKTKSFMVNVGKALSGAFEMKVDSQHDAQCEALRDE